MVRIRPKKFELLRILVPIDFSDTSHYALEHAVQLSSLGSVELVLLHVIEGLPIPVDEDNDGGRACNLVAKVEHELLLLLAQEVKKRTDSCISTLIVYGATARKIVETALSVQADLILLGAQGFQNAVGDSLGSTADYVVRHSAGPVVSINRNFRQHPFTGYRQIVLPLDSTQSTRVKVPYAAYLARFCGAQLHVLGLSDSDLPESIEAMKTMVRSVERFLKPYEISYTSKVQVAADKVQQVLAYAEEHKADLITIMRFDDKLTNGILQSSTEIGMHQAQIPVFSIGEPLAEGFISN